MRYMPPLPYPMAIQVYWAGLHLGFGFGFCSGLSLGFGLGLGLALGPVWHAVDHTSTIYNHGPNHEAR